MIEGRWVKNTTDAHICAWVLSHARPSLPPEMQLHILQYMYNFKSPLDDYFAKSAPAPVKRWSKVQMSIYHSFLTRKHSDIQVSPGYGATTVIAGIAAALLAYPKKVMILSKTRRDADRLLGIIWHMYNDLHDHPFSRIIHDTEFLTINNGGWVCSISPAYLNTSEMQQRRLEHADVLLIDNCIFTMIDHPSHLRVLTINQSQK